MSFKSVIFYHPTLRILSVGTLLKAGNVEGTLIYLKELTASSRQGVRYSNMHQYRVEAAAVTKTCKSSWQQDSLTDG